MDAFADHQRVDREDRRASRNKADLPASGSDLSSQPILFVDLDGTLILTDVMWESLAAALRLHPIKVLNARCKASRFLRSDSCNEQRIV